MMGKCRKNNLSIRRTRDENKFTDSRDGKKYKTVTIGSQTWMAENLNFAAKGSKCHEDKSENCEKYGRLYNRETTLKACPSGWHLPNDEEWQKLVDIAGGDKIAGTKLKATSGWDDNDGKPGNGTDEYGFSALPGGRGFSDDNDGDIGYGGNWWTSTESNANHAYYRSMNNYSSLVFRQESGSSDVFSVRCLQDYANTSTAATEPKYAGIYEYKYPYASAPGLSENHYIVLSEKDGKTSGFYYGTSDDFDEAREGYDASFFVAPMNQLKINGNKIEFVLNVTEKDMLTKPVDLKITSTKKALEAGYKISGNMIRKNERAYNGLISDKEKTIFFKEEFGFGWAGDRLFAKK